MIDQKFKKDQVFVSGLHAAYPRPTVDNTVLDKIISSIDIRDEQKLAKLRKISKRTGIKSRPVALDLDDSFYHSPDPPKVEELTETWLKHGLPLCHQASTGALTEWGGDIRDITHLVAATCSVQCHPGIDAYIAEGLKLRPDVSRILLSGVGCAGAAALLRTAHELALAMTCRNKAARILIVACDLNSLSFRSEVEQMKQGQFPIGLTLFSDGATAAVVRNGIESEHAEQGHNIFEFKDWVSHTIPDTIGELQLMPTAIGNVSTISQNLPSLVSCAVREMFSKMIASMPELIGRDGKVYCQPSDFEWDIHPGGLNVFDSVIEAMGVTRDNTHATVTTYENWGNSAGPTLLKVLDVRRSLPVKREYSVCCGFGNNLQITMLIMKRT